MWPQPQKGMLRGAGGDYVAWRGAPLQAVCTELKKERVSSPQGEAESPDGAALQLSSSQIVLCQQCPGSYPSSPCLRGDALLELRG